MDKINAVITGVGGYVPEDVLTNEDISKMVDTTDEWIMTRVGIKERRILKGEGVGLSYMGYTGREAIARENEPESGRSRGCLDRYDYPGSSFPDNFFYHRLSYRL